MPHQIQINTSGLGPESGQVSTKNAGQMLEMSFPSGNRSPKETTRKRIFITGANSLLGHSLFEQMRNDHITIHTGAKAHKFVGTIIKKDEASTPLPSDTIRVLDVRKKPKNFTKNVLLSDILIIDL